MKVSVTERREVRQRYLEVDSSNVADVLDTLGFPNQGISPQISRATGGSIAGWAYTIKGAMMPYEGTGDPQKMTACGGIRADEISVWSGSGDGVCYFGELIAAGMMQNGSAGAIVDGGIRDSKWLEEMGFSVFAAYKSAVQSIGRWKVTEWQTPVYLPGATTKAVTVEPGDFILGDDDGAIVIPKVLVTQVLERAEQMTRDEVAVRAALRSGLSLSDALETYGHV